MELLPKKKSDVELTGISNFDIEKWSIPYATNVSKEFKQRYDSIKKSYEELLDEIEWNNIIYNIKIKYEPVIGNTYYLYKENNNYSLSIIAPWEWYKKESYIGSFTFDHKGKWNKIK